MVKKIYHIMVTLLFTFSINNAFAVNKTIPSLDTIQHAALDAYHKYRYLQEGKNADYIPELAKVNPNYFAIVIATVDGKLIAIGDANVPFAIESIEKLFAYSLALEDNGEETLTREVGLNATGDKFNSVQAIESRPDHLQNPFVNAGAIQVTSLIKGKNSQEKWQRLLTLIQNLSDQHPYLGQAVYESEMATNQHNRAIAHLLDSYGLMYGDVDDAVDRYTKACSIMINTRELAIMGATLANHGVHPISKRSLIPAQYVQDVLSEMVVNGMYENSGTWWWSVGLPTKSGVGGGLIAIIPGEMAIAVYSPPIDQAGNSVRAQRTIEYLSKRLHLHLLSN